MAYVAVTKKLIEEVGNTINALMTAECNSMANPDELFKAKSNEPHICDLILDEMWKPEADLRDRLEKYSREASVKVVAARGDTVISFYMNLKVPCFRGNDRYSTVKLDILPEHLHYFADCLDATAAKNEASKRWTAVKTQVTAFLESCKSINEAVKLWPDVQRYLPNETVQKLGAKTEKQARDMSAALEALKAIDMDTVSASHVLARMAGART